MLFVCLKMPEVRRNRSQINFVELLNRPNPQLEAQIGNLEKLNKRKVQALYGVKFNQTCMNENIHPNYKNININIYIYISRFWPPINLNRGSATECLEIQIMEFKVHITR